MKPTHTALIVPALTDIAGQCYIVAREGLVQGALTDYRADPYSWKQVGLMNSRGKLVWLTPWGTLAEELAGCSPLMAGLVVTFCVADSNTD